MKEKDDTLTLSSSRHYREEAVVTALIAGERDRGPSSPCLVSRPIGGMPKKDPFGFAEEPYNKNIG